MIFLFGTPFSLLLSIAMAGVVYAVTEVGTAFWATVVVVVGLNVLILTISAFCVAWEAFRVRAPVLAGNMKLIWLSVVLGSLCFFGGAAWIWWVLKTLPAVPTWVALGGSLAWVVLCVATIAIPPEERARMRRGMMAPEERGKR